jgi:hypothetical protein
MPLNCKIVSGCDAHQEITELFPWKQETPGYHLRIRKRQDNRGGGVQWQRLDQQSRCVLVGLTVKHIRHDGPLLHPDTEPAVRLANPDLQHKS